MKKQISLYVDEELYKVLEQKAWDEDRRLSNFCVQMIRAGMEAFLRKDGKTPPAGE